MIDEEMQTTAHIWHKIEHVNLGPDSHDDTTERLQFKNHEVDIQPATHKTTKDVELPPIHH